MSTLTAVLAIIIATMGFSSCGMSGKPAWKDAHWEEDLQKAFDAGKRMAERIMREE